MPNVGIYADVTGHSTSVPFYGIALGCVMDGAVPIVRKEGAKMKDGPENIPRAYLLYVVIGILLSWQKQQFSSSKCF
jgi:hypothetical protein